MALQPCYHMLSVCQSPLCISAMFCQCCVRMFALFLHYVYALAYCKCFLASKLMFTWVYSALCCRLYPSSLTVIMVVIEERDSFHLSVIIVVIKDSDSFLWVV